MAGAFVVVLLVAIGDAEDPSIRMAAKTTHDALEDGAIVVVREVEPERLISDGEATKLAGALNANAIAVVIWRDPQHRVVGIHAQSNRRPEWVDRSLTFADGDAAAERGRTIGFEVASIVSPSSSPPPSSPPPPPIHQSAKEEVPPPPPPTPKVSNTFTLELVGTGAVGKGAGGFGGDLSGRFWFFNRRIAAHLGAGARAGDTLTEANANILVARFAGGLGGRFVSLRAVDVGGRLDGVALWHHLSRNDVDANGNKNATSSGSFLAPGLMGLIEGSWRFAESLALVVAAGAEVAFGSIRVFVDDQARATIQSARGVAEVGLRWEP